MNGDWAYVGIGDAWARYEGLWVGLVLHDGKAYAYEINRRSGNDQGITVQEVELGSYTSGQAITATLEILAGGHVAMSGPGFNGVLTPSAALASYHLVLAVKDSADGFEVGAISTEEVKGPHQPVVQLAMYAGITVRGEIGASYTIEATADLSGQGGWAEVQIVTLTASTYLFVDTSSAAATRKYYRARRR